MTESAIEQALRERVQALEDRLTAACRRSGRPRSAVTLVAVTKTVDIEVARFLPELGVVDLGENRPQELWRKAAAIAKVRWHLIGHLQRNKIARSLPLVTLIHSADSLRLLTALEEEAQRSPRPGPVEVLLEVNASGAATKGGFTPEELPALVPQLATLPHLRIRGLMTMAALEEDPEQCRPTFARLHELRERLRAQLPAPHALDELSMGMSHDFEVAIEEGATLVRIGTALFEDVGRSAQ